MQRPIRDILRAGHLHMQRRIRSRGKGVEHAVHAQQTRVGKVGRDDGVLRRRRCFQSRGTRKRDGDGQNRGKKR